MILDPSWAPWPHFLICFDGSYMVLVAAQEKRKSMITKVLMELFREAELILQISSTFDAPTFGLSTSQRLSISRLSTSLAVFASRPIWTTTEL